MIVGSHSAFSSNIPSILDRPLTPSASFSTQDAKTNGSTQPRNSLISLETCFQANDLLVLADY